MFGITRSLQKTLYRISHIHFVGIGGSGMAGIAEVLLGERYHITGSDISKNAVTKRLASLGATVFYGHDETHILGADVLVVSTAIDHDNVEVAAAKRLNIPVISRAEMLAELMRFRYSIAIAGSHGKTTTTSLLATIFSEAGYDPTFVIGGRLNRIRSNAQLGAGQYLIAEADESDASFLHLLPMMSIVTNIDTDHLRAYHNDFSLLKKAFCDFLHQLPFYGLAVLCYEDAVVQEIIPNIARPIKTYGFSVEADIYAHNIIHQGLSQTFMVESKKPAHSFEVTLNMPGKHNVLNALACIAIALEQDISPGVIATALQKFQGIDRRFTVHGDIVLNHKTITLIDDYGHHPEELRATFDACKEAFPDRRMIWIFQPHRYTRTQDCFDGFCHILQQADNTVLLDVYSAGESFIPGADSAALYHAMGGPANGRLHYQPNKEKVFSYLSDIAQEGDILLFQGAGNIRQWVDELL